jgi:hypothetical protein
VVPRVVPKGGSTRVVSHGGPQRGLRNGVLKGVPSNGFCQGGLKWSGRGVPQGATPKGCPARGVLQGGTPKFTPKRLPNGGPPRFLGEVPKVCSL